MIGRRYELLLIKKIESVVKDTVSDIESKDGRAAASTETGR